MIKQFLAFGIFAATLGTSVSALSAQAESFKSFLPATVSNLDPLYIDGDAAEQVGALVHRGLVAYAPTIQPPRNGAFHQVIPAIAQSWEIGPDKKSYIFELNPDARFHNGRPVTAADVKYSLERVANPLLNAHDYWAVERLNIKGLRRYQAARRGGIQEPHLLGVEVLDHHLVQIHLEHAIPYALELLALPSFSIVPAEDVERWWKDFRTHPIGAGPYTVDELKAGSNELVLKRFAGYYDQKLPHTQEVHFATLPSQKEQFQAFTRRELDHSPLPVNYLTAVLNDPVWNPVGATPVLQADSVGDLKQTRVVKTPSWTTHYISMDNKSFPFSEVKVRQAFNFAVDKRNMIQNLLETYGQPVTGVFPPGFPGSTRRAPLYAHNPEQARKLLFEAGWRDKDGDSDIEPWQNPHLDLTLYHGSEEESLRICRQIQSDLKTVGVTVKIAPLKSYNMAQTGRLPAFFHNAQKPLLLDPSGVFYWSFHSEQTVFTNVAQYANPRVDELISQAEDLTYEPKRYELYREAERLIVDDAPWLYLFHPVSYALVQPRVSQYTVHPSLPYAYEQFDLTMQTAGR